MAHSRVKILCCCVKITMLYYIQQLSAILCCVSQVWFYLYCCWDFVFKPGQRVQDSRVHFQYDFGVTIYTLCLCVYSMTFNDVHLTLPYTPVWPPPCWGSEMYCGDWKKGANRIIVHQRKWLLQWNYNICKIQAHRPFHASLIGVVTGVGEQRYI